MLDGVAVVGAIVTGGISLSPRQLIRRHPSQPFSQVLVVLRQHPSHDPAIHG